MEHTEVAEAATFAVAEAMLGQAAHAAVVLRDQSSLLRSDAPQKLRDFLATRLHSSKVTYKFKTAPPCLLSDSPPFMRRCLASFQIYMSGQDQEKALGLDCIADLASCRTLHDSHDDLNLANT